MPMSNERVEGQLRDLFGGEPPDLEPSLPVGVMPLDGEVRPRVRVGRLDRVVHQKEHETFVPR
jgi:hypothetical protein